MMAMMEREASSVDEEAPRVRVREAYTMVFSAFVVLLDRKTKRLRQSPKAGQLTVNTTEQVVWFIHDKGKRGKYCRTLLKPHKCVVVGDAIKIWSRVSKESVLCRLASPEDQTGCLEALQIIGVRIIDVSLSQLTQQVEEAEPSRRDEDAYNADLNDLTAALTNPRPRSELIASLSSYNSSPQLASDIAAISRAFFEPV